MLVQLARERGYVTVEELVDRLEVTHQTVRRDINFLCDEGILSRFHGGAAFRSSVSNLPYEARRDSMSEEKAAIARAVASDIPDRSSVFIDIGTTAEAVAAALTNRVGLRVVTNNINVVSMLAKKEDFELVICGGSVRNRDLAVVGQTTTEFVARFHVDYSVIGIVAIADDGSVLDFSVDEEPLTQAMIRCARQSFVVADHSKFGRHALAKVAHLSEVTAVYSDARLDSEWLERVSEAGGTVRLPR